MIGIEIPALVMAMVANVATCALAINLRKNLRRSYDASKIGSDAASKMAREFLRAKLLAGGENRHYAYHVAGDGLILRADAEAFYLALFARIHDFWELVAGQVVTHVGSLAVGMNEINRIDGECDFTCVDSRCGKTYIDAVFPRYLPYPYKATRMTAEEFKQAIVDAKAEAAKRSRGDNNFKDGFESIHA